MGALWSFLTDTSPLRLSHRTAEIKGDYTIYNYMRKKRKHLSRAPCELRQPYVSTVATSVQSLCLRHEDSDIVAKINYNCLTDNLNHTQVEALCLCKHNSLRFRHKVPPLVINSQLSAIAEDWANQLAAMKAVKPSPYPEYGENMCLSKNNKISVDTIIQHWYDEIESYDFRNPGFSEATGHFTQIVWRNTKEMGVGVVPDKNGIYVVILYCPPGNFDDQFCDNVTPPITYRCAKNMYFDNAM